MTVQISKPAFNLRDSLNSLRRKIGIKGAELMRANTVNDIYALISPVMFRNRLINGAMQIDQRNAGAAITINTWDLYPVDRFNPSFRPSTGTATAQRVSDAPSGFVNSLKLTQVSVTTADPNDVYYIAQKIEGYNSADLGWGTASAKTVTVSFWVKSSVTGTYSFTLQNINATRRSYVSTYTINSANTWEQKTITIAGDTSGTWETTNSSGVTVIWDLGSGSGYQTSTLNAWQTSNVFQSSSATRWIGNSGATFQLTGVQLEVGTQATPFEHRPYATELMLCQRYFEKSIADGTSATATANPAPTLVASAYNTTTARTQVFYKTPKRVTPTLTTIPSATVGTGNQWGWYNGSWNGGATSVAQQNANAFSVDITGTYTQFYSYIIDGNWYASAEL